MVFIPPAAQIINFFEIYLLLYLFLIGKKPFAAGQINHDATFSTFFYV
jgi:hypothetical protein